MAGACLGSGSRAHPGPQHSSQCFLSPICLAASSPPAALALLSPYCIGRTVCLHVELGSSPAPWLSCRGCHCLLWSVRCPPPSPAAGRDRRASCSRGMPCGGALTPWAWPAPLVPRRLPARLPWAPERQGHTLWTRV